MEQQLEDHRKHSLGRRAFFLFLSRRINGPLLLFIIAGAVWYGVQQLPPFYAIWGGFAAEVLLLTALGYLLMIILFTYLEYRVHTYVFTDEALMITSGLTTRKEIAALYHQIQNVNIDRSMSDRFFGISQIVIFMTGADREFGHTKIVLPALSKTKAKVVQRELLVRARRHVPPATHPTA